jgi:hypothetical protein
MKAPVKYPQNNHKERLSYGAFNILYYDEWIQ